MSTALRQLLKKGHAFTWLTEHQEEFESIKDILCSDLLVKFFNPSLPTQLLTDASRHHGLGYMLTQLDKEGRTRIIKCGSRSLTPTESRYATIELEGLAIQWAIQKCDYYLRGHSGFTVVTDHRPLLGIFSKPMHMEDNPRLLRIREKLVAYSFDIHWTAGKTHLIADALSRAPVFTPSEEDEDDEMVGCTNHCYRISSAPQLKFIFDAAAADPNYNDVMDALRSGLSPKKLPTSHPARPFFNVCHDLSLLEREGQTILVLSGTRMVIPVHARPEILRLLHIPHAGKVKTKKAAQLLYYWPGMTRDIQQLVESCSTCQERLPSQAPEPLHLTIAAFPMSDVAADLFDIQGQTWLVMVDRYSGYPFTKRLHSNTTKSVTDTLFSWFLEFGLPNHIRTDGGPQF